MGVTVKDGLIEFGCRIHGIDYRIACEECGEKWGKFKKVLEELKDWTKQRLDEQKETK